MATPSSSSFSFVHAADLHLGSPLLGLALKDEELACRFAAASRRAFTDLVTHAIDEKVSFLILAGDIYDGELKDASVALFFNREVARLHRAGIPVYIVKGNHDAESVVTKSVTLPENVLVFPTAKSTTFRIDDLKVALHGRSFPDRSVSDNYAITYPTPVPGWFNIGVLHTSCDGRPGHATYAPCTVQDLIARGYQYWALGHVHEHEILLRDPLIVFPGNLQGRSIRECGPKGACIIQVSDGQVDKIEHVAFDHARFGNLSVPLDNIDTEAAALSAISHELAKVAASADGRMLALRVTLRGATPLHHAFNADPQRVTEEVQAIAQHHHEEIWLEKFRIATSEPVGTSDPDGSQLLDLSSMLDGLDRDPEVLRSATEIIAQVTSKLPGTIDTDQMAILADTSELIEHARSLILGRLLPAGATHK
ncbi:MAG: DNA repair exonuclease [Hyphomicrobium sp.]